MSPDAPPGPAAVRRTPKSRSRPALLAVATLVSLLAPGIEAQASLPAPRIVKATQAGALLITAHRVHSAPDSASVQVALLPARTPITGETTTLPIVARYTGRSAFRWLRVMLPGRPNGSTGWIAARGTRVLTLHWHLIVNLRKRRVNVYRDGRLIRTFRAVVGKPSTPTPTGQFFVEESEQMPLGHPGGPYALALSARSDVLREFEGGPGQIAVHGLDGLAGKLGAAESHGCVRLSTPAIDWLAARIVPGTPTTIYAG